MLSPGSACPLGHNLKSKRHCHRSFCKVVDNYLKWCRYLGKRVAWTSLEAVNKNRKIILVALYLLIWGEAANVRFLPERRCYIFHNMAKELIGILDSSEPAEPAKSCTELQFIQLNDVIGNNNSNNKTFSPKQVGVG